ncbi:hypothetical protein ACT17Q_08925 [Cellulomonas sp. CW35]|uniref:hypothetical protein n=1 Tax=Cellulomonas TaxID=1707 RepID=UPI001F30ABA1|nr:hypothetical protein [Cellulomonas palmilytica]UJP38896.1 hypothetical protein F1D97_10925 [Cellulomonas palmilytica]
MNLVWATRGRTWGFRFLLDGGLADPLATYDRAFAGLEGEREVARRVGSLVVLRFADPEGRRDAAGRTIPHDVVVLAPVPGDPQASADEVRRLVWPTLADAYAGVWSRSSPPSAAEVAALRRSPPR